MTITAINAKNQFRGKIKGIIAGDVVSEVEVETENGIVTSVITTSSLRSLGLDVGSEVLAIIKATDVALAKL